MLLSYYLLFINRHTLLFAKVFSTANAIMPPTEKQSGKVNIKEELGYEPLLLINLLCFFFFDNNRHAVVKTTFGANVMRLLDSMALRAFAQSNSIQNASGASVHPSIGFGGFTFGYTHFSALLSYLSGVNLKFFSFSQRGSI